MGSPGWALRPSEERQEEEAEDEALATRTVIYLEVAFGVLLSARLVGEREHSLDTLRLLKRLKCCSSPCWFAYHGQGMSFLLALLKLYEWDFPPPRNPLLGISHTSNAFCPIGLTF